VAAFQASAAQQLRAAIPAGERRPVKVFSQDESRFGLLTVRRRRLTARGVQPVGTIQHVFDWFYVYGAVAPTSGESFFLELPYLNSTTFQVFLTTFAQAFPDSLNVLLLDKSGGHTATRLVIPENVRLVWLPPASPELNPIERVWRDLKDALAWQQFPDLAAQQAYVGDLIRAYDAAMLQSLTGYPYLVDAIHALSA
jgi:transposase